MDGLITKDKLLDKLKSSDKKVCLCGTLTPDGFSDGLFGLYQLDNVQLDMVFKKYNSFELEECMTFWALTIVNEKQKAI